MNTIKILMVDDHEVVRAGYRRLLESSDDFEVVAEAGSGEEAYKLYIEHSPDVVIMDLSLKGMSGLEAIHRIRQRDEEARVLVFSMHTNATFLNRALAEGVLGYITKRSSGQVLLEALKVVANGEFYIGQELQAYLVQPKTANKSAQLETLSSREFEIFVLMAQGKTTNEIAELLNLSPKTVGHHYTSVKRKLNVSSIADLTRLAIREGLLEP